MPWLERKNELNKQIELNCGFGELRRNLDVFEEMKEGGARDEIERKEKVENQLPTIQEENENEMGMDAGETGEEIGDQNQDGDQQEVNIPMEISNENNENVGLGGGK